MGLIRAVLYILAQSFGAVLGAGILWTFTFNEVATFTFYDVATFTSSVIGAVCIIFLDKSCAGVRTRLARSIWSWRDPAPSKSFTGFPFSCFTCLVFLSLVFLHCVKEILYSSLKNYFYTIYDISVLSIGIQPNNGNLLLL